MCLFCGTNKMLPNDRNLSFHLEWFKIILAIICKSPGILYLPMCKMILFSKRSQKFFKSVDQSLVSTKDAWHTENSSYTSKDDFYV